MSQDAEQLRLLAIFHYVLGGIAALFSLFPLIYLLFGLSIIFSPQSFGGKDSPPAFVGWLLAGLGIVAMLVGLTFAVLVMLTGRYLHLRKHYMLCFVIACIECLFMPFGTVLGVLSLIVLTRESVKALFAGEQ